MRIINNIEPAPHVLNTKNPNNSILYIDFTKYPGWLKSIVIGKKFSNFYENERHTNNTIKGVFSSTFPHAQQHIKRIVANQEDHCHLIDDNKRELCIDIIQRTHTIQIGDDVEVWQLGTSGAARVIGPILSSQNTFTFYPMFVDCNHMIYESKKGKHKKDYRQLKCFIDK